jgi:hypothetical protein
MSPTLLDRHRLSAHRTPCWRMAVMRCPPLEVCALVAMSGSAYSEARPRGGVQAPGSSARCGTAGGSLVGGQLVEVITQRVDLLPADGPGLRHRLWLPHLVVRDRFKSMACEIGMFRSHHSCRSRRLAAEVLHRAHGLDRRLRVVDAHGQVCCPAPAVELYRATG